MLSRDNLELYQQLFNWSIPFDFENRSSFQMGFLIFPKTPTVTK